MPKGQVQTATTQDTVTVVAPQGDIATTINYSARDSILFEVDRKVVHLYGDAKIDYGTISLKAAYIEIDYDATLLTAASATDSAGKEIGVPVFADGGETYAAKGIAYNYKTRRGRISEVVTQQGEGYIHSEVVKKNEHNEIFGLHNKYTTCNLEHPHFYISAPRIKAIPNDKVMSGPFNLVIGDIPTPLGFLFGLFPTPKSKRSSGVLIPTFGESRAQGFYLSNGGYYLALNEHIGTSITGDIYSLGGYNLRMNNDYINRYSYRGNLSLEYRNFKNDEVEVARSRAINDLQSQLPPSSKTFWINWSHTPVQKPGRGRFNANVRAGSAQHQRLNLTNGGRAQYLAPTFNSSISYQKTIPNSPFSYGVTLQQGQTQTGTMNFVLPDLNFAMTAVSIPEILGNNNPTGAWYEKFNIGYNLSARNEVSNVVTPNTFSGIPIIGEPQADTIGVSIDNLGRLWRSGRRRAEHNFQIGLGNYKVMKYFNFTPSVSYRETWADKRFAYRFNPDSQRVEVDTVGNFGRIYNYNAGASLSTAVYGTVFVGGKRVEAIRHTLRPNISYNYTPNFGNVDQFGFYQRVVTGIDPNTNQPIYQNLSRFGPGASLPFIGSQAGPQSAINFGLQNNVEMKVRSRSDSTDNKFEKVSLIDNLSIVGGYNFAADSVKLSTINMNMNTNLFKIFNINFNSIFDPYQADSLGRRLDRYMLQEPGFSLARLTTAGLQVSASFNPASRPAGNNQNPPPSNLPSLDPTMDTFLPTYVDFNIPWTLNFSYSINYTRPAARFVGQASSPTLFIQNLGIDGTLNLTEKWKIQYTTSYDFVAKNISNASFNIYRDLHCWEMSIGWIPFGFARGYNFTINARSALLRDLRLTRNRAGFNR